LKALIEEPSFVPFHPIEVHFYAGEEAGLKASQAIAQSYVSAKVPMYAMLQADMTGYKESSVMGIMTDNVDVALTNTLRTVAQKYTNMPLVDTRCGYGCSGSKF
jgi:leucyl aminopeptidase